MFRWLLNKITKSHNDKVVSQYTSVVGKVNALEGHTKLLSNDELLSKTMEFREQYANGRSLHAILPEAFAVVREASLRIIGMRHYDVQLMGGMALHDGCIAEMRTGEGKTLVATLPSYLNAISGKGVHVVTVNDYLAQRDYQWMSRVHNLLGLSTGLVIAETSHGDRKKAYASDVTYVTNTELGFDYLRDNMKFYKEDMVLSSRLFNYAIIDEMDSILIDEARTPLIISGPSAKSSGLYIAISAIVKPLRGSDFEIDEKRNAIQLTEDGIHKIESGLRSSRIIKPEATLYDVDSYEILNYVMQSLRAHNLFKKDKDYIVKDGSVMLVDEFTGRIMDGRRYSDGLHQAIEAKEGVRVQSENQMLASITYQNLFRMYDKLSGMTGTAQTEAGEFLDIYKLKIVSIPTYKPIVRKDHDDIIFKTENEKFKRIVDKIKECNEKGQPVLVGTTSIAKSEILSEMLQKNNIKHNVLNAKYHKMEAKIIADAGRIGGVTIATNMAGRGTDIILGGNLDSKVLESISISTDADEIKQITEQIHNEHELERQKVIDAGGLFVIGSERHESRRIDNQLRGRSGRLGDPGESQFYLSLQDDLLRIFGGQKIDSILSKLGFKENESINHPLLNRVIAKSQQKIENHYYDIRKNLLKYDDIMNEQRIMIYRKRNSFIDANDIRVVVDSMMSELIDNLHTEFEHEQDFSVRMGTVRDLFGSSVVLEYEKICPSMEDFENVSLDDFLSKILELARICLVERLSHYPKNIVETVYKKILITSLDEVWKEHLYNLGNMREAVHLRAYAQKDPLTEYKMEAFELFKKLFEKMHEICINRLMHVEIHTDGDTTLEHNVLDDDRIALDNSEASHTQINNNPRNKFCHCGSGKKYKNCHGKG